MLTRRSCLVGASALVLTLHMPSTAAAPPLDHEALVFVASCVQRGLAWWNTGTRMELYKHAFNFAGIKPNIEQAIEDDIIVTTNRLLRASFRSLQTAGHGDDGWSLLILEDGKLTIHGEHVVLGLPLAPSDWWPPELFDALAKLAPHYLA